MKTMEAAELFLNSRKALNRSIKTRKWHEGNLKRFAAFSSELPTEPEPIDAFLAAFPSEQDENRHGHYRTIRALYRFLYRRRKISSNPMDFIEPPKRTAKIQPTLEPGEMLLLSIQAQNPRDKGIIQLLFDNGVRASELCGLKKQNIFNDYILVEGKEGQRIVPISEDTRRLLVSLFIPKSDYIFRGKKYAPLTIWGLYKIVRKYLEKIGIHGRKLGPHRLRHTVGKTFLENGGDIRTLQKIFGHADVKTTQIYSNLANKEIIAKHHQFTPLRALNSAAQENMFENNTAIKEAEEILKEKT